MASRGEASHTLVLYRSSARADTTLRNALRPGGRLALADIVSTEQLREGVSCDASLWAGCIGGAMQRDRYREAIEGAGLHIVELRENPEYRSVSLATEGPARARRRRRSGTGIARPTPGS